MTHAAHIKRERAISITRDGAENGVSISVDSFVQHIEDGAYPSSALKMPGVTPPGDQAPVNTSESLCVAAVEQRCARWIRGELFNSFRFCRLPT